MQAKTVSVGPVTAAVANQVAAFQAPYAGQVVLNGAGATFSINNVAASQDPTGAGNLTLVSSYVSFSTPRYIYVTSVGDDSALTFTIYGFDSNNSPIVDVVAGANAKARVTTNKFQSVSRIYVSGNCSAIQVGSFVDATFTGATARQVTITSGGGDESGKTFVITGLDANGSPQSESILGPSAASTVTTSAYFQSVTSVTVSAETAGLITIGMTQTATSPWVRLDDFAPPHTSIQCSVRGSVTYTVQSSLDDPNDPITPISEGSMVWVNSNDTEVVNATTSKQSNFLFAPKFARVIIPTIATGSVRATFLQSSNGPE